MSLHAVEFPPEQMDRITEARRIWAIGMARKAAHEARQRAEQKAQVNDNTATKQPQACQKGAAGE